MKQRIALFSAINAEDHTQTHPFIMGRGRLSYFLVMAISLLLVLSVNFVYGEERAREISILRLSTSELDRAISDLLCLSYEVIHPLYSCSEGIVDQERFTKEYRARKVEQKKGQAEQTKEKTVSATPSSSELQQNIEHDAQQNSSSIETLSGATSAPSRTAHSNASKASTKSEERALEGSDLEDLKRLALQQNNPELREFDFIITSEQFFNEELKGEYQLLLPLYQKAFTAITRSGAANQVFHRENIFGVLNQDFQLEVARNVLSAVNLNKQELVIRRYKEAEMMEDFCQFDINVAFVTGTHPDSLIRQLNTLCDGKPVSITRSLPKDFFQRNRYLYRTTIAKEYYWRLAEDIETLSARYLLAVNKRLSDERIAELLGSLMNEVLHQSATAITVEGILRNYENLQTKLHPLGDLMIRRDLLNETIELPEEEEKAAEESALDERIRRGLEASLEEREAIELPASGEAGKNVLELLPSLLPEERQEKARPAVLTE